jgi:uncharacterized protein YcfJ
VKPSGCESEATLLPRRALRFFASGRMNKQIMAVATFAAFTVAAVGACGYQNRDREGFATVIEAKPTAKTVSVPRQECHDEMVTLKRPTQDPHQITGTVLGAVLGGVIGNQVGSGRGKDVAKFGGAAAGGYAGNKIQEGMQERNTYQESQRTCKTVHDSRQESTGYDVTYRLDGQERMVHMDHDPGREIPVENGHLLMRQ